MNTTNYIRNYDSLNKSLVVVMERIVVLENILEVEVL